MTKKAKVEKVENNTKSEAQENEKKSAVVIEVVNQTAYDKMNEKRESINAANLYAVFRGRDNYNKAHLSFDCTRELKLFAQAKQLDENRLKSATRNIAVESVELYERIEASEAKVVDKKKIPAKPAQDNFIACVKTRDDFMKIESYTTFELFDSSEAKQAQSATDESEATESEAIAVYTVSQHKDPRRTEVAIFNAVKAMILEVVEKPARLLASELSLTIEAQAQEIEAQEKARKALEAQVAEMLEKFAKLEAQAQESESTRVVES